MIFLPMVPLAPLALPMVGLPLAPLAAETVQGTLVANGTNGNQWLQWQNPERSHRRTRVHCMNLYLNIVQT